MRNSSVSSITSLGKSRRERSNSCVSNSSNGSATENMSPKLPARFRKVSTSSGSFDVVKSGYLHMKRPPTGGSVKLRLKTWQKRFLVLRDESFEKGSAQLEVYSDTSWRGDKGSLQEGLFVDLQSVVHVDEYTDSKNYPHAFTISRTGQGPLVLGADSESDLREWMVAIQVLSEKLRNSKQTPAPGESSTSPEQDALPKRKPSCPRKITHWNSVHELSGITLSNNNNNNKPINVDSKDESRNSIRILKLPDRVSAFADCLVTVCDTEDSKRHALAGDYNMIALSDEIFLQRPGTPGQVLAWPMKHIVKLKSEEQSDGSNLVTLETRANCGKCRGRYMFQTSFGRQIMAKVSDLRSKHSTDSPKQDVELERLRVKAFIRRAPSSPDILSRSSPPPLGPSAHTQPDVVTAPPGGHDVSPEPPAYLDDKKITTPRNVHKDPVITDSLDIPILLTDNGLRISPDVVIVEPKDDVPPEVPSRQRKSSHSHGLSGKLRLDPPQTVDDPTHEQSETPRRHSCIEPSIRVTAPTVTRTSPITPRRKLCKLPPLPPAVLERISPPRSRSVDSPPSLPPRRASCGPPLPPPRPQHTLGTHSSRV